MYINLDKRPDYFFLKGIFQGGAQKKLAARPDSVPLWTEPPIRYVRLVLTFLFGTYVSLTPLYRRL